MHIALIYIPVTCKHFAIELNLHCRDRDLAPFCMLTGLGSMQFLPSMLFVTYFLDIYICHRLN